MIDQKTARSIVERRLDEVVRGTGLDLVIAQEVEFDLGWIFYSDSRRYLETRDFAYAVAGNAAIVVSREDGTLSSPPTSIATPEAVINWYHNTRAGRKGRD